MDPARGSVLAIDLGTSGPKVLLVDAAGRALGHEFEPVELLLTPDGGAEQRPDDWWSAIVAATRRLLARGLVPPQEIVAVACTAQWSGTVAVDRSGRALHNALIWLDSRGAPYMPQLVGGWPQIDGYGLRKALRWIRVTGGLPGHSGKDPVAHILWLRHQRPDVFSSTHQFLEPKDYLNLRLTGRFAASIDSIAAHWLTDNRDLARVDYDPALLRLCGLDRGLFPDLARAVDLLGPLTPQAAAELGLSERVQVVAGTPDLHSAAIGSGAIRDYQAHLYIGTSAWLSCHVPYKKTDPLRSITALPSAIPGRYMVVDEQECAGACLSFLRDHLFFADDGLGGGPPPADIYRRFDALAAEVPPGSGGLLFLPWLNGERSPLDDRRLRGGFINLGLGATRGQMIRAVLEGVAFNARWLLGAVERFVGRRLDPIHIIGGGAASALWCQIFADVTGRTIRQVARPIEANARGAAFIALVALGYLTWDDVSERVEIAHTFAPSRDAEAVYGPLFREFHAARRALRPLNNRLNRAL
jgi:xylulokinase